MPNNRLIVQQGQAAGAIGGTYDIFGTNLGAETVTVFDNTTVNFQGDFSRGGDTIKLTDVATDFTIRIAGSNAILTSVSDGITIVVPIPNVGSLGTTIVFENSAGALIDSRVLIFNGTNVVLGTQTVTTSDAAVVANGNGNSQNSLVLTAGVDTTPGGNADDTYIGFNKTLNAGDKLDGGAGYNTLSLSTDVSLTTGADPAFTYGGFTTVNVQRIEVTNDDNLPVTLDLSGAKGVETVVALNSSEDISFTQITALNNGANAGGADIELNNVTNGTPNDPTPDVTVQYQDSVVSGATTVDVVIKTSNANTLTIGSVSNAIGGVETVAITNKEGASTLSTLNTDLTTLKITATQNLTIDNALHDTVRTIDATGSTATLDIDFSSNDAAGQGVTYTGSTGQNIVLGGDAADNITTFGGDDFIVTTDQIGVFGKFNGPDGDDTVNAGNGNNTVTSGDGNDSITSGTGNDVINANNGNNIVNAGDGANSVTTGTGADQITTGTGKDTISSGAGNDLISSGGEDDLITIGSGLDTVDAGSGNDTVVAAGNFDASGSGAGIQDSLTFGAGTADELQVNAGAVDAQFTNVTGLEVLTLTTAGTTILNNLTGGNGDSAAQAAGIQVINLNAGNDSVNAADFTSGLTVNGANGGNDTVQTGSGNDTYNFGGALTDADALNAGAGSDTLNLDGDVTVTGASQFTGFETINLDDDESTGANLYNIALDNDNAPTGNGTLTINGSALQNDEGAVISTAGVTNFSANITTGAGADNVTSGSAADTISTNGGNDSVTIKLGGNDTVDLGSGNDTLFGGAALTSGDVATGGADTDTVDVVDAGRAIVDADFTNLTAFEVLNVAEAQSNTLGKEAQEAGLLKIVSTNGTTGTVINAGGYTVGVTVDISATGGGANNDQVTTGSGNDTVIAGVGDQNVSLGLGDDQILVDGSEFTFNDTVSGGGNTATGDSLVLDNTNGGVTAGVNLNNVTGVENFQFLMNGDRTAVNGFEPDASTITFTGGNVLTQTALNISAAALVDTTDSLTVVLDAGQTDADFRFNVTGSVGSTTVQKLNVNTNNDINFQGGTGVDRLEIHGNDLGSTVTMEGGAGRDVIAQTGGLFTDDGFVNINNVEILTATGGAKIDATLGIKAAAADIDTIQDTGFNDRVILDAQFTNNLTVNLSGGNDTINAGATSAVMTFNAIDTNLTAADQLTGGTSAADVLNVSAGNAGAGGGNLTNVTGVETINVVDTGLNSTTLIVDTTAGEVNGGIQNINAGDLDATEVLVLQAGAASAKLNVTGGAGGDSLNTGSGNDTVNAGEGNNTVNTDGGTDSVTSGSGNDSIDVGTGDDVVNAGDGNNLVFGRDGADTLTTGGGSDSIDGGNGNDTISSGGGNDQIYGGFGQDVIDSGAGADQLLYRNKDESSTSTGRDTVTGFTSGSDVIDVRYVAEAISKYGEGATIKFAGNLSNFGDAQGATIAGDKIMDIVYDTSTGALWVDLNDDGTLNGNDLQIVLQGVASLQARDVLDTAATGAVIGQTLVPSGTSVTGTFLDDNFVLQGPGNWTVDGGLGNDKVQISGQDISGSSITNVETAVINGSGTMTYAQHNAFSGVVSGTGEPQTVTLTGGVLPVTGAATIENYVLTGGNGDDFTIGANNQSVDTGSGNDIIRSLNGVDALTGTINGGGGTGDQLILDANDDISGATLIGIESTLITQSTVTMTAAQHGTNGSNGTAGVIIDDGDSGPTSTGNGTNSTDTINITTATDVLGMTGLASIENYNLSAGNDKFTVGALGQNVNAGAGTNEVTTGALDGYYTGTITGSGTDTLTVDDGDFFSQFAGYNISNIATFTNANISGMENLVISGAGTTSNAFSVAQHNAFASVTASGTNNGIVLSDEGTINARADIEQYDLSTIATNQFSTAASTVNVNAAKTSVNVNGISGNDTINVGGLTVNGIYNLNGGGDTIVATSGANIAGVNTGLATSAETLSLTGDITMTEAQHDAFTTISGSGTNVVTLSSSNGDDNVTGNASIESYVLNDAFTFNLGFGGQNVTGNAGNNQTVNAGVITVSGTLNGGAGGTDTLNLNGSTLSNSATISNFENVVANGTVTISYGNYNSLNVTGGAGSSDQINFVGPVAAVTAHTGIENYVLADLAGNDFTFANGTGTKSVTTSGANNDVVRTGNQTSFAGVTLNLAGNAGGADDTLVVNTTATDLSGLNGGLETTAETLTIDGIANVSMTAKQHQGFTAPFNASGTNTVTITTGGVGEPTIGAQAAVENYVLSASGNTINVNGLNTTVNITGVGGNDTINLASIVMTGGSWNLDGGADTLVATNGASISAVNGGLAIGGLETLQLTGGITMTELQHDGLTTITAPGVSDSVTLSASNGNDLVTGNAAIETYNLNDDFGITLGDSDQDAVGTSKQSVIGNGANQQLVEATNLVLTGTINGGSGAGDLVNPLGLISGNGDLFGIHGTVDITGATFSNFEAIGLDVSSNLILNETQYESVAAGQYFVLGANTTITLAASNGNDTVTADADIANYALNDQFTINLVDGDTNVTGNAANSQNVVFDTAATGTATQSGTLNGGTGAGSDTLSLFGTTNINTASVTNFETLVIGGAGAVALSSGSASMTTAQYNQFTSITDLGGNADQITFTTGGTVTSDNEIDSYVMTGVVVDITLAAGSGSTNLTSVGAADTDTVRISDTVSGNWALGSGFNELHATGTTNITGVNTGAATTIEKLFLDGSITMTAAQYNGFSVSIDDGTAVGSNLTADTVTISNAGTITADDQVENYVMQGGGSSQITFAGTDAIMNGQSVDVSAANTKISITNSYTAPVTPGVGNDSSISITGFGSGDSLDVNGAGLSTTNLTVVAGSNVNAGGAGNDIIVINGLASTNLNDLTDGGAVEQAIAQAIANLGAGTHLIVLESPAGGTTSGVYLVNMGGTVTDLQTSMFDVEMVALVNHAAGYDWVAGNFT